MARYLGPSWRTTIAGLILVAAAVYLYVHSNDAESRVEAGALMVAGVGLVKAADSR